MSDTLAQLDHDPTVFEFHGSIYADTGNAGLQATLYCRDEVTRDHALALFPKSYKVKAGTLTTRHPDWVKGEHGYDDPEHPYSLVIPTLSFHVNFAPTGVTGDVNEAGFDRARKFVRRLAAEGYRAELRCIGYANVTDEEQIEVAQPVFDAAGVGLVARHSVRQVAA